MQDIISSLQTQSRGSVLARTDAIPVRRLILRGNRRYLRALRAAEMEAWENGRRHPARFNRDRPAAFTRPGLARRTEPRPVEGMAPAEPDTFPAPRRPRTFAGPA
jgi:hypothetical protein